MNIVIFLIIKKMIVDDLVRTFRFEIGGKNNIFEAKLYPWLAFFLGYFEYGES